MKKILIAFIASVALVLGMGAFTSGASAADYPGTVPTVPIPVPTPAPAPIPGTTPVPPAKTKVVTEGSNVKITIKIKAGNVKVKSGTLIVKFNGKTYKFKVRNGKANVKLKMPKVSTTQTRTIKFTFKPSTGSVFKTSKGKSKIKIRNK
ncbi:hypothetical protein [Aeromicrobium fastidiosum]|uniref:Uncharacterized protein n=1 Tax=Aeromicrobium fastidiosum TaxID=52699 RepID=A0A641ARA5_9ACTN|nr:hypothetical protein [Aeromicrobium fastidiosum]KAA1380469.1 hypothetical protein ESP62_004630 [Aeromicrobium fastidiosum]MBP2390052.1 hypothetical protein [Aeromicrobium fastidiosum]